ncbi:MAG: cell division protein FtsQ [Lachnospiraceae bacterium]|nr:cell division protein FtsQ [Lachnospiraceae bacterium]
MVVLLLIASLLGGIYYLLTHYKIKEEKVYVDGNLHYTKQEIMDFVMEGPFGDNSLYLSFRYKNKSITDIPFIAAMDVTVLAPDSIRISVFEKSLAGYVEYLGRYMYFDKDGIIVESSSVRTAGIPEVTGLTFDHVVVGQPLPVENKEVFYEVLTVTQSLDKYDLTAERIYFNGKGEMTLFLGDIRVAFGTNEMLDEKIILIQSLMPKMEGMKGTLDIKNYSENTKIYTFEPAK